jgi:hypothetical protein
VCGHRERRVGDDPALAAAGVGRLLRDLRALLLPALLRRLDLPADAPQVLAQHRAAEGDGRLLVGDAAHDRGALGVDDRTGLLRARHPAGHHAGLGEVGDQLHVALPR